jgi:hypothetical protein
MSRFERVLEPHKVNEQPSLLHLVHWLYMICATGILLACATGAVAVLSRSNTIEAKATGANFRPVVLRPLPTPAPVSVIEIAQMVDKAEAGTKIVQGSIKASDAMPTLAVDQVIRGTPGQPALFHLSINADGVVPDHSQIAIHGLPKGTSLSAGRSDGLGGWFLAPDDLGGGLSITPSDDAEGSNDLVIQLVTPEGRVASELRAKLVVSAGAQANASPPAVSAGAQASANPEVVSTLPPDQIQVLLSHGRDLQRVGYFAGARLFFERAAQAGSAEGARALGETYDPVEFQKLGVRGLRPDAALARKWYDRAQELEAQQKQTGAAE